MGEEREGRGAEGGEERFAVLRPFLWDFAQRPFFIKIGILYCLETFLNYFLPKLVLY